jgi:ABC-type glycerol-3-phosphate transport system substrate-binding protein
VKRTPLLVLAAAALLAACSGTPTGPEATPTVAPRHQSTPPPPPPPAGEEEEEGRTGSLAVSGG